MGFGEIPVQGWRVVALPGEMAEIEENAHFEIAVGMAMGVPVLRPFGIGALKAGQRGGAVAQPIEVDATGVDFQFRYGRIVADALFQNADRFGGIPQVMVNDAGAEQVGLDILGLQAHGSPVPWYQFLGLVPVHVSMFRDVDARIDPVPEITRG